MRKIALLFSCFIKTALLHPQPVTSEDSAVVAMSGSTDQVKRIYDTERGKESGIYNGILYYSYSSAIEGIPFFKSNEWHNGNVWFDNIFYKDILMKYELVNDQLIVSADTSTGVSIALYSPRVKEFTFDGMQFGRLTKADNIPSPGDGFYLILARGKLTSLSRSEKHIDEWIENIRLYRKFTEKINYYGYRDSKYFFIKNKKDLVNLCRDHRKEVQQFITKNKLKYRKDPETMIVAVTRFYNQL